MLEVPDERVDGHPDAGKHGRAVEDLRTPVENLFAFHGSTPIARFLRKERKGESS
jgi:hypothetical protein